MEKENSILITQSNALVSSSYQISLAEKRIILYMLSQIRRDDEDFKPYTLSIKEFAQELNISSKNLYERAQLITQQLMSRVLNIKQPDGLLQVSFLSSAKYHDGKGYVELCFDPQLKPYLLQLKECFTTYDIRNVLSLKSFHSIRIYELLKQFEILGERTIEIDELKYILGLQEQYKSYNLFKTKVLVQAQKDLEKNTDLSFDFQEIKSGRRIERIKFIIKRKQKSENILVENTEKNTVLYELLELGIEKQKALQFIQVKDLQYLTDTIEYAKKQYKNKKVHSNLGGYLKSLIEKEITPETEYERKLKEEAEQKALKHEQEKSLIQQYKFEYSEERNEKIQTLMPNLTDEELKEYFAAKTSFEKTVVFDSKGNFKVERARSLLKAQTARENNLEDSEKAFREWVKQNKGIELAQKNINGQLEWVIVGEQLSLL